MSSQNESKDPLPTLYEYYTGDGIQSGLEASHPDHFVLNSKPLVLYSGTMHYFRIVPEHWQHMLTRFKAAGLNSVQFYLPWNLHESIPGRFDFESPLLNLEKFLQLIKDADLFAIVRPGPYICAEWEFGGLPSWLLHDPHMSVRSNYEPYKSRVKLYWNAALRIINKYQFTFTGGPVIMLQLENEYSHFLHSIPQSKDYLRFLQNITRQAGFRELLFTSDPGFGGAYNSTKNVFPFDSVLETLNSNQHLGRLLRILKQNQPGKPAYVAEFWSGWYDRWNDPGGHHTEYDVRALGREMEDTLFGVNGSLNLYPFVGGTNWGFMNGMHVATSWDFDAPLTINGDYTPKYHKTRELYEKLVETGRHPRIRIPDIPPPPVTHAYEPIKIVQILPLEKLLEYVTVKYENVRDPGPMEWLNEGADYGQRHGFVLYRVEGKGVKEYEIRGRIRDRGLVLIDGREVATLEDAKYFKYKIENPDSGRRVKFDLLVENMGRPCGPVLDMATFNRAHTGLLHDDEWQIRAGFRLDQAPVHDITVYSLDFEQNWVESLKSGWEKFDSTAKKPNGPAMYRAELNIADEEPKDTFLQLPGWTKGNAFVNGFNLGRYWSVGPQQTLYLPGPLLRVGGNLIELFELHEPGVELTFSDRMIWSQKDDDEK